MLTTLLYLVVCFSFAESQCAEGWRSYDGSCWFVSNTAALTEETWQGARGYCLEKGGDLASVTSQQDQEFIIDWAEDDGFNGELWIGLNQLKDRNSDHAWSDGSTDTYRAWGPDQPNTDGQEKCVFTKLQGPTGCYERLANISTVDGIIDDPVIPPEGCKRHYISSSTWQWCEEKCNEDATCEIYTHFDNSHPDYFWMGECFTCTRSVVGDNRVSNEYATSGIEESCGDDEFWYTTNCGNEKGFVCKKSPGSDQPVTVPPTPQVPGYCPGGFFGVGNKCFKLYRIPYPDGISWDEAREKCLQEPGIEPDLASITSLEEQSVVTAALTNHSWGLWIGYREFGGKWLWVDNDNPKAFTNWHDNPGYLDCAEVKTYPPPAGKWGKLGCGDKRGYICQTYKDTNNIVSTTPESNNNCPSGFVSYWYGCYKLQTAPKSFSAAQTECSFLNSQLVSIHDEAENAAVFALAEGNLPLWIGLQKDNDTYEWLDGWPDIYTKWGAGEPGNGEGCVAMDADSTWKDTTCSSQYAYMCKYTEVDAPTTPTYIDGVCPSEDWLEYGAHCFYIPDYYSYDTKTWEGALEHCRTIGAGYNGDLASIHNRVTNEWLYGKMVEVGNYYDGYWIGLKREDVGYPWEWMDGSGVDYLNWAPGEPRGQGSLDSCVEMYSKAWPGLWNDHTCTEFRPYVCMAEKGPPPTTPTLPPQGPGDCPSPEWIHYGDHCFLFRPDANDNWVDANYGCHLEGSSLASIQDATENWFIHQKLRELSQMPTDRSSWIGLIQTNVNDNENYHWHGGAPLNYTNWASGEPNNPQERCVEMDSANGKWNDEDCEGKFGYVCIFTKEPETTSIPAITTEEAETTDSPPPTAPPSPTPPPQSPGDCPSTGPWVHYGAACFLLRPDDHVTWAGAREGCLGAGGDDLASIHDVHQDAFVLENSLGGTDPEVYGGVWIGLYQSLANSNDYYHWTDGTEVTYTHWAEGEPSDAAERCVFQTATGEWEDGLCGEVTRGYVCKYEKNYDPCAELKRTFEEKGEGGASGRDFAVGVACGAAVGVATMLLIHVVWRKRNNAKEETHLGVTTFDNKTFDETDIHINTL